MCQAIRFSINNHPIVFSFADAKPCLPLLTPSGHIKIIPWGNQPNSGPPPYPVGNTAYLFDAKYKWRAFRPNSARIACEAFLMKDAAGVETWFEISAGYIAGVVATAFDDHRAYILMRNRQLLDPNGYPEWPIYNQA